MVSGAASPYFFMHLPKTGGLAVVKSLEKLTGHKLPEVRDVRNTEMKSHVFAPSISYGHVPARNLAQYWVFTFVREPRSRVLSLYRYFTAERVISQVERKWPLLGKTYRRYQNLSLSDWLWRVRRDRTLRTLPVMQDMAWYFLTTKRFFGESQLRSGKIQAVGRLNWLGQESFGRLAHDLGLSERIERPVLVRSNNYDGHSITHNPLTSLSLRDRKALDRATARDFLFLKRAFDSGNLEPRTEALLDREFLQTAGRLGFEITE